MANKDRLFEHVLKPAVIATENVVGTERGATLLNLTMKQYGLAILERLAESDSSGIFVPVDFAENGKDMDGCVLTLQDRAIFAWSTGTFRVKTFDAVVLYSSVKKVAEGTRPKTRTCVELSTVRVSAEREWTMVINDALTGGKLSLTALLVDILSGSATVELG